MSDAPSSSSGPPPACMDEKWKLTKKGSMNARLTGTTSTDSSGAGGSGESSSSGPSFLRRSDSTPASRNSFSRKCAAAVKEKRARFYIVRRCVTMLACWKEDFRDS